MATIDSLKLMEFLRKRKFDKLGGGAFSSVFAPVTSDRVVKICRNNDDWPHYIIWATKHGYAGGYAPKVYSLHTFDYGYVAIVERLQCLRFSPLSASARKALDFWHTYLNRRQRSAPMPQEFAEFHTFFQALTTRFPDGLDLHNGNVMARADGSLVLTDPITHTTRHETFPKRMRAFDIAWVRNAHFQSEKSLRK